MNHVANHIHVPVRSLNVFHKRMVQKKLAQLIIKQYNVLTTVACVCVCAMFFCFNLQQHVWTWRALCYVE